MSIPSTIIATLTAIPTEIQFTAENLTLRVDEEPSQVYEALSAAGGLPFRLSIGEGRGEVHVNTPTVAFWHGWVPPPERMPPPRPPSHNS
jgi:hypothetical protein